MTKADFLKRLKQVSQKHTERFGFPFLPVSLVREELGLSGEEFQKLLTKAQAELTMTPLEELVLAQLPAHIETVVLEGGTYISLAIAK
jgi:hypothetical protein